MRCNASYWQKLLAGLILLTTCTTILALSTSRERRRIGIEESSHRPARTESAGSRLKLSSNKNNAITTEPGRKVSHRLIGGHLKVDTKGDREESLWDDGILMSSAGNGKEGGKSNRGEDDDEKKTLSQQVKEGKYGLIQNEIYKDSPKRPGIISYLGNPEVPKDTSKTLGGLDEDEIWLAENHVLVLRGGRLPARDTAQGSGDGAPVWPPIDDYKAPRRQVKIPARPKVPPPFPVQLKDGGPIQIIGRNGTKEIENGTIDYKDSFYTKELLEGDGPHLAILSNGTIISPDFDNVGNFTGDGLPLNDEEKKTKSGRPSLNGPPTFYHAIPPGAVFVPPPSNLSDYDDEDQSIYYPPPYSFKYHQDNTTAVPPGPLVPGIILPPPPDFFSPLEEKKPTTTKKYSKRPGTTPPPRPRPTYLPPRKLTTKQYKTSTVSSVATKTSAVPSTTTKLYRRPAYKNISSTVSPKRTKTVPYVEVSTIVPDTPTTLDTTEYYTVRPIVGNQVSDTNKQGKSGTWSEVHSKTIPVLTYYPTTTPSTLEKPIVVTPASIKNIITTTAPDRSPNQASYYFYEESNNENAGITADPTAFSFQTTTESPTFFETRSRQEEAKKEYYSVETIPSQETAKDYSIKFIDSLVKNSQMVQYNEPGAAQTTSKFDNTETRAQNQRMLPQNTAIYYPSVPARPIPEVEPYYSNPTTPKPINRYRQEPKPKAVYQYSFQAADYSKRGGGSQKYSYNPPEQSTVYNSYDDLKGNRHQYVYEDSTPTPEEYRSESEVYGTQQRPVYPQPTDRNLLNTTPNPQHAYFTQQEEKLLDDVTKEYFTIFGKKISGGRGLPSTTPIYGKSSSVTERPNYSANPYVQNNYNTAEAPIYKTPNVKVHYGDQSQRQYSLKDDTLVNYKQPLPPINPDSEFITKADQKSPPLYSLKGDTLVNYRPPLPPINPDSEFITIVDPKTPRPYTLINDILVKLRQPLPQQQQQQQQRGNSQASYAPGDSSPEEIDESYASRPYSLEHDIDVNYRDPRPTINPDAEFIEPVRTRHTEKPNSYIAYKLPGDSGHFYFLTPRAITPRPEQSRSSRYPKWRYRDDFFPRGLRQRRS